MTEELKGRPELWPADEDSGLSLSPRDTATQLRAMVDLEGITPHQFDRWLLRGAHLLEALAGSRPSTTVGEDDAKLIRELLYLSKYGAANGRERGAYKSAADRIAALSASPQEQVLREALEKVDRWLDRVGGHACGCARRDSDAAACDCGLSNLRCDIDVALAGADR